MNTLKTGLLMAALTALFIVCGHLLGGAIGVVIAVALALVMNIGAFWFSDKLVLKMTRAQPVTPEEAPDLYAMTARLAERADIPMPRLYIVPDPSPNAFATGRSPKHGVVAVNEGLLRILNRDEVEGVIAHEIAHIKHRDTLTSAIVATVAGAISGIANIAQFAAIFGGGGDDDSPNPIGLLLMAIVAPIGAMMIQFAVSRSREFEADRTAAELVGSPRGLQNALWKLHHGVEAIPGHTPPAMAQMCIVNPLHGGAILNLFSTHPPVEKRIEKLGELEQRVA